MPWFEFVKSPAKAPCAREPALPLNKKEFPDSMKHFFKPRQHEARCKVSGLDLAKCKSIVHFDAYPVHISEEFRTWVKKFPFLILIYVPANFSSKMQVADVALNRPLKADYAHRHMRFLATACREKMAAGVEAVQVRFEADVSKCAGATLSWLVAAYNGLSKVNMTKTLQIIGYTRCWDKKNKQLRQRAMQNMGNLFAGGDAVPEEPAWQLVVDGDDDLVLDEGGKDGEVYLGE